MIAPEGSSLYVHDRIGHMIETLRQTREVRLHLPLLEDIEHMPSIIVCNYMLSKIYRIYTTAKKHR